MSKTKVITVPEAGRHQNFAEMGADGGGDVKKLIAMVRFVEPPERRDHVVGAMPPVDQKTQNQNVDGYLKQTREPVGAPIKRSIGRPARQRDDNGQAQAGIKAP